MTNILNEIPNKIENNKNIEEMIRYLNDSIKGLDVMVIDENDSNPCFIVVQREIYEENIKRKKENKHSIKEMNVFTCSQYLNKIKLEIKPFFEISNDKYNWEFLDFDMKKLYENDIKNKIRERYENLLIIYNKERSDSWSKIESKNNNAIARKTVDYSTFEYGTVIATRYHKSFTENLSQELIKGGKVKITIVIDINKYDASINFPNLNRKDDVIRLTFGKKLKELLSEELNISYQYIMKEKDEGAKGKVIKLPDEYKEYIDFYKGEEKDTFIVKLIKRAEEAIDDGDDEDLDENDIEDIDETSNETEIISCFVVEPTIDYIYN